MGADIRSARQSTGDTWTRLALDGSSRRTPGPRATSASVRQPRIGAFNGVPGRRPCQMEQLGMFQPILRRHGNHAPRLPYR
jgi:hypothetical protein